MAAVSAGGALYGMLRYGVLAGGEDDKCPALEWLYAHRDRPLPELVANCPEPSWLRDLAARLDIDPRLSVARLAWRVGTTALRRLDEVGAVEQGRELRRMLETTDLWEAGAPDRVEAASARAMAAAGLPMDAVAYLTLCREVLGPLILHALDRRGIR